MTITADQIIRAASLLAAIGALISGLIAVYKAARAIDKVVENNKKQNAEIAEIREEQTISCYALQGCLKGLIEQGCDGPCKDALDLLNKHLNKKAHKPNL